MLRRWWVRWIVLPIVVLLAAHAGWTLVLSWKFEGRLEELRASGAPVDLKDLRRPRIPDEDNAAALWEEAHRWHEAHLTPEPACCFYPDDLMTEEDREAMAEWLAKGDAYVDLLGRAAARPDMWQDLAWEKGPEMEVQAIPQMQEASTYLSHRARLLEREAPGALRELAILLDLAPKLERPILIVVLVRWTVQGIAADALKEVAAKPGFDPREARALLDARLAAADDPLLLRDAFRGERVIGLSLSRRWIGGESPWNTVQDSNAGPVVDWFSGSWLARPLAYRDAFHLLDLMDRALRLTEPPPREAVAPAEALMREYKTGLPNLFSHLFATLPVQSFRQRLRHQAKLRIARVGLALLDVRQQTGAWPETLDAVVPMVGEEWTIDPYAGERLRYEPGVRLEAMIPIADEALRADDEIVWRFGG